MGYSPESRATVRNAIKSLEEAGHISVQRRTDPCNPKRNLPNRYRVHYNPVLEWPHHETRRGVGPIDTQGGTSQPLGVGPDSTTNQEYNQEHNQEHTYTRDSSESTGPSSKTNDPISKEFARSPDRKELRKYVQELGRAKAAKDYTRYDSLLTAFHMKLAQSFNRDPDMEAWGLEDGWDNIPAQCSKPYDAGTWLNKYLNAWANDDGPLTWTPKQAQA